MHRYASLCLHTNPNAPKSLLSDCMFLVRKLLNVAQLLVTIRFESFFHEYSLFYGGNKTVETRTPVDIFKRKIKARLLEHINEDDHDRGPSVTVNRAEIRI